jgi:exopolysaccharide biosynthesis polyprenyl glycosylphosphotransferase
MPLKKSPFPVFLLDMAADIAAVAIAYYSAYCIRFLSPLSPLMQTIKASIDPSFPAEGAPDFAEFYLNPLNALRIILLLSTTLCLLNAFFGLYSGRRYLQAEFTAFKLLKIDSIALMLFVSYLYLSHNRFHPRSTFLLMMLIHFPLRILFRKAMIGLMALLRRRFGIDRHPVLLAGEPEPLDAIESFLRARQPHGLYPAFRMSIPEGGTPAETAALIIREAAACRADTLCCCDSRLSLSTLMELLDRADERNLTVKICSPRLDLLINQAKIESDTFRGYPLIHFSPTSDFAAIQRLRRLTSALFSIAVILLTWPLFLAVALLVKLTSRGPALFIQERVGWDGRHFRMLKFRTMFANAAQLKKAMLEQNAVDGGALFKIRGDPRVTLVGRFLRKLSLDELPQFFNVLVGDMNVVGPRPLPAEDFHHYYEPWHRSRHKGLPGITGLWQVSGRSDLSFEQMCLLDVYYLHNASLSLDLSLLFRTAITLLFAEGAY